MKRTKIVATIGPSSSDKDTLLALIDAGMNVARLNLSHGTRDEHALIIKNIRDITKKIKKEVAILLDLPGPKLRLGKVRDDIIFLKKDELIDLGTGKSLSTHSKLSIPGFNLANYVKEDSILYLADGAVKLKVLAVNKKKKLLHCIIIQEGVVRSNQGVNIPSGLVGHDFLSKEDKENIKFGEEQGVDYFALSFVQHTSDIQKVRKLTQLPLIIKIEKPLAIENLEELIIESDGVMIARGDLGVEMSLAQIPVLQKKIIKMAGSHSKIIITATQMLESMITSQRPTRAEVTDVANAILDGTDAIMLSAETAIGEYPALVVSMMKEVADETEPIIPHDDWLYRRVTVDSTFKGLCRAAVFTGEESSVKAFLVPTDTGYSAKILSSFRPKLPIYAFTFNKETQRRASLYWGVEAYPIKKQENLDNWISACIKEALRLKLVEDGDKIGIVTTNHINHLFNIKTINSK